MFGIARANLEQVAILAGDVVDFQDFWNARQLSCRGHVWTEVFSADGDEGQKASIDGVRVDKGDVIFDDALGFELPEALQDGRWRQSNGLS